MTQDYYGTKRITAWTERKEGLQGYVDGYAVKYTDGYISWSPKEVFEAAYQPLNALSFGHALVAMEEGHKVARAGWNGKGMYLVQVLPGEYNVYEPYQLSDANKLLPFIAMRTADAGFVPWLASQTDMLAKDWRIVE